MDDPSFVDQRKHPRASFAIPVEFKLLSRQNDFSSFSGQIKNISLSGAFIQFEDKYGRVNLEELPTMKVKIGIYVPDEAKIMILSVVRWIRKDRTHRFHVNMGVEFEHLESWQASSLEKLITMKNKDRNMMWNLWENYAK